LPKAKRVVWPINADLRGYTQMPNFKEEKKLWKRGYKRVAGLDEAGRGPLAGPVVASAVVITTAKIKNPAPKGRGSPSKVGRQISKIKNILSEIKDSKKLAAKKREEFYKILTKNPKIEWGIGVVSEKVIDKINIKNATELAMEKAVSKLKREPDFLIIDGKYLKNYKLKTINHKLIVRADEKVFSCAAASIIAKVTRDRIMMGYHKKYPEYRFNSHKGYGTQLHLRMLRKYGPCKIHRKSFAPVAICKNT